MLILYPIFYMYSRGMNIGDFYDQYVEKVYKFFYIKTLNRHIAEDLTSQTFIALVESLGSKKIDNPQKYLYGIMRNNWTEFLKDKYKQQVQSLESIENFEEYAQTETLEFELAGSTHDRLKPFIDRLPPKQQAVLTLRIFDGLNVRQTAEAIDRDVNYVKVTYRRAIARLRQNIKSPFLDGEEIA